MRGDIETYHEDDQWKNKVEGNQQASSTHPTKGEAVQRGRMMAMNAKVEHIIRNMDGTISERNSYGNDPRDIPG